MGVDYCLENHAPIKPYALDKAPKATNFILIIGLLIKADWIWLQ